MYFVTRELRRYVDVAVREMELRHELELASEVQQRLLPHPLPELPGYDVTAISTPATHTGGDYYDCLLHAPDQAIFTIADVTGHGIGPTLITASCRAYLRAILGNQQGLTDVMRVANQLLTNDMYSGKFVTLAALKLDMGAHRAEFLSAGHAPTLLIRADSGMVETLSAQAMPMGIDVSLSMDQSIHFEMAPGDMFVMFSDGYYEWRNASGEPFGIERLTTLLKEYRQQPAEIIKQRVQEDISIFTQGLPQQDDATLLIVKRMGL
jgi:phosphoserine phosphatase